MKQIGNYLFFYGGIYSNWFRVDIRDPLVGLTFPTSEQAWMWQKANFFGDWEISNQLTQSMHPKEAKALGRKVDKFDNVAWECVGYGFMVYVNYLKFMQNADLGAQLVDTGNLTLVEASPYDKIWGIGLGLTEDDYILGDSNNWCGENRLGKALVEVRKLLQNSIK